MMHELVVKIIVMRATENPTTGLKSKRWGNFIFFSILNIFIKLDDTQNQSHKRIGMYSNYLYEWRVPT